MKKLKNNGQTGHKSWMKSILFSGLIGFNFLTISDGYGANNLNTPMEEPFKNLHAFPSSDNSLLDKEIEVDAHSSRKTSNQGNVWKNIRQTIITTLSILCDELSNTPPVPKIATDCFKVACFMKIMSVGLSVCKLPFYHSTSPYEVLNCINPDVILQKDGPAILQTILDTIELMETSNDYQSTLQLIALGSILGDFFLVFATVFEIFSILSRIFA